MGKSGIDKMLYRFYGSFQYRGVDLIKRNGSVRLKKCPGLGTPKIIQTAIHSAALNDAAEVKICLSVANNVYFFRVQFVAILALFLGKNRKNCRKNRKSIHLTIG
jgi:hypothetical protein